MKIKIILISTLLCAMVAPSYAINTTFNTSKKKFKQCYKKANTTLDLRQCISREYQYYNGLLNSQYKKLSNLLAPHRKQKLILAEKAWIDFRNKDCDFSGLQAEGGTLQPVLIGSCYVERTKERIKDIKAYLKAFSNH